MFIAALFTIVKSWKQPKCTLDNGWIKKIWYIYMMEYYSVIIMNEIMPFSNTDLPRDHHTKGSKPDKDKHQMMSLIGGSKNDTNELTKPKQTHKHRKQTYSYQRGTQRRRDK